MAEFFNKLLESRELSAAPIPLWKLNVSKEEYAELKKVVHDAIFNNSCWNYAKEFALFYAEWWRQEYPGGWVSKEIVARAASVPEADADNMFKYAKSALNSLNIPVIRQNNNQYFRTLLLQGGLPMTYVQEKSGFNKFQEFLKSMIAEFSRLAIDWDDIEAVKRLNCINYLPDTYRNDNIYAVSLQIARAIHEERDDLLPYSTDSDALKKLTEVLKKERKRVKNLVITHPLTLNWTFSINSGDNLTGQFYYSLDSVKTIYSSMINGLNAQECFQFDIFVSQQYVATYKKIKINNDGIAIYKRVNSDNKEFKWTGDSIIDIKAICDNDDELHPSVANTCVPNLSIPQLFQKNGDQYIQRKDKSSSECIVIYPTSWEASELNDIKNIIINGEFFSFASIPDANIIETISIKNKDSEEELSLKNLTSKYSVIFGNANLPWLERANYALLTKKVLVDVYDENGDKVQPKSLSYREIDSREWHKYSNIANIHPGIVEIKVECPDGSCDIKKFYFIGDLKFTISDATSSSATIKCEQNWGKILYEKQDNILFEVIEKNNYSIKWNVQRINPNTLQYSSTCSFDICKPGNPVLKVSIPSPYEGICLIKDEDSYVYANTTLSFNELSHYRILCSGKKNQYMKISYTGLANQTTPIAIHQKINNGITPLSFFEDPINRLFNVNGINSFDRESAAVLKIGDSTYKLRYFTLDSTSTNKSIYIKPIDNLIYSDNYTGNIYACKISDYADENIPTIIQLEPYSDNKSHFTFPKNTEDGDYIVFSDVYDQQRVIPRLYHIMEGHITDEPTDTRSNNKKNNIDEWKNNLNNADITDPKTWGKIPLYIQIADQWKLPFRTFNAISASVSSPNLTTKLLLRLLLDDKIEPLTSAILKIEQECAMAIHWNKPEIIAEQMNLVLYNAPPQVQMLIMGNFIRALNDIMTLSLDSEVAELMTRFLCNNLPNKNADLLTKAEINEFRQRAIGRNTDDSNFNTDLPITKLDLKNNYYPKTIEILPYQETLIKTPLYVYEYTQGWNDSLWDSSKDQINRRRIINFYRLYYKYTYYTILVKMLK